MFEQAPGSDNSYFIDFILFYEFYDPGPRVVKFSFYSIDHRACSLRIREFLSKYLCRFSSCWKAYVRFVLYIY